MPSPRAEHQHPPDPVFDALGDPTRRQVLALLSEQGPATATTIAAQLPISRQAVAKHLDVLRDAGIAEVRRVGREARYELLPSRLDDATAWLESRSSAWAGRLQRLEREIRRRSG